MRVHGVHLLVFTSCNNLLSLSYIFPPLLPLSLLFSPSGLSVAPFLSFEWSLPSESGQYELLMEQQPRSHHRAHYETEGSRGAVKTPKGGHPEVQVALHYATL